MTVDCVEEVAGAAAAELELDEVMDEPTPGKMGVRLDGNGDLVGVVVMVHCRVGVKNGDGLKVDDTGEHCSGVIGIFKRS